MREGDPGGLLSIEAARVMNLTRILGYTSTVCGQRPRITALFPRSRLDMQGAFHALERVR